MRRAKSIVYINIGQISQRLRQNGIVFLLARFEARIFQHDNRAGLRSSYSSSDAIADDFVELDHRASEQF